MGKVEIRIGYHPDIRELHYCDGFVIQIDIDPYAHRSRPDSSWRGLMITVEVYLKRPNGNLFYFAIPETDGDIISDPRNPTPELAWRIRQEYFPETMRS